MNGTEGLKRIRDGEYDLLILDIMLPGMNGYEILKKSGMKRYSCAYCVCKERRI